MTVCGLSAKNNRGAVRVSSLSALFVLAVIALLAAACSDKSLSLFFDIPPPTEQEKAERAAARQTAAAATRTQAARAPTVTASQTAVDEGPRPEFESVLDWETAQEMLPKDDIDEVDWMAAMREGIIRPRAAIDGPGDPEANLFKFNFYLPGPDPTMDAYFPHQSHTEWLTCESCHAKIFRYRGTELNMDAIFSGEYCAKCHGIVAFALDSCNRCHQDM